MLFLIDVCLLFTGMYLKNNNNGQGEFLIGISVLILAFLLIPLFVYRRYKGKDISKYSFKDMQDPEND